jgi:hypothetical protein
MPLISGLNNNMWLTQVDLKKMSLKVQFKQFFFGNAPNRHRRDKLLGWLGWLAIL